MLRFVCRLFAKFNPHRNLKARLGVATAGLVLLLSTVLSLLVGYTTSTQIQNTIGRSLGELAYQMTDKLDRGMFERYRDIQILATLDPIRQSDYPLQAKRTLLEKLKSTYPDYAWIGVTDRNGIILASTGGLLEGVDASTRPVFKKGRNGPYVGDVHDALMLAKLLPNPTGEPLRLVELAAPVTDSKGKFQGTIAAHLSWMWASEVEKSLLEPLGQHSQVEIFVLAQDGQVLLGPRAFHGQKLSVKSISAARANKNGYSSESWPNEGNYVTGFAKSQGYRDYPGLGWLVLVRQKADVALAPARSLQDKVFAWGVGLGTLFAALGWWSAGQIVGPMLKIAHAARSIQRGDDGAKIPIIRGYDEMATLSESLSHLVDTLHNQQQNLKILNEQLLKDIADRNLAQSALQKSEAKYRQIVDTAYEGIWRIDSLGRTEFANQRMAQMLGYTVEEMLGRPIFNFMDEDARIKAEQKLEWLKLEGKDLKEVSLRCKDGSSIWVFISAKAIVDEEGEYKGAIAMVTDISSRKQAESERLESDRRFSTLFNGMNDYVLVYHLTADNKPGLFIEVNEQACKKLGYTREELLKMSVTDILDSTLIDAKASIAKLLEEKHIVVESVHITKDGRVLPVEVNATLFALNGCTTVQAICRDITDRKKAEQALRESERLYRAIGESIDYGVWVCAPDGQNIYASESFLRLVGMTQEECSAFGWGDVLHPDDTERTIAAWKECVRTGGNWDMEHRFCGVDGNWHSLLARGVSVKNERGEVIYWAGINLDISRLKRAESEREQLLARERAAREEAESANRLKDEFLAVLSHELRSPLNPILGWAKILRTRKVDEKTTEKALETIERNAKLQAQLIEDLLDVSRILQGKLSLNVSAVNLVSVIEAAMETVQLALQAKSIDLRFSILDFGLRDTSEASETMSNDEQPDNLKSNIQYPKLLVAGDPNRLQQVIWNLLSNAVKFTPSGGSVEIQLSTNFGLEDTALESNTVASQELPTNPKSKILYPKSRYAQISVSDTGKGISPDFLPFVFDYFRQENSTTTRKFGGLGLGLAIVRQLVELHGGTVFAESPGEDLGATFTVRLPLMTDVPSQNEDNKQVEGSPNLEGVRVLLVDDEVDNLTIVVFALEQYGVEVKAVASAKEALEIIVKWQPDLLLSDIGMPQMDGYMLIRQIRAMPIEQVRQIPAIALTAYAGDTDQQQILKAGFQRHVTKPVEPAFLANAIAELLKS